MYIQNTTVKNIYRIIFVLLCEAGIVLQYAFSARTGSTGILTCYYTILTNFLCLFYFGYLLALRPKRENTAVKGAVTMSIILTGLGYHLLLTGVMESSVANADAVLLVSNQLVHTVVPLMAFADYLLFTPKGTFKPLTPLMWTLIPIAYLIFAVIRAQVSTATFTGYGGAPSRYPYPFMDFDALGAGKAALSLAIVSVAYIALGYLFFVLDKLLGKGRKKGK